MELISKKEQQEDGTWFIWVRTEELNTEMFEMDHEMTEEEAEVFLIKRDYDKNRIIIIFEE